jgi:anion-transporting  ArsA/GET3 family ATPase
MTALSQQRLLVVTGKGGVGRSAISAAAALTLAQSGERVLVCEVNAQERISRLLGKPEVGPEIGLLEQNLWAVNVRPEDAMREYGLMILRFRTVYRAVFENRLVRYFLRFVPSLQELVMLGKILYHVQEKTPDGQYRFDRVIMDAPATGHAISFLQVPQVIRDTVPPGPLAKETEAMRDLLISPALTATLLVSLPEEMPVNETVELGTILREQLSLPVTKVYLNAFIERRFTQTELSSLEQPELAALAQGHERRAELSAWAQTTLQTRLGVSVHPLPRLYQPEFGRAAIEELAHRIAPTLKDPS